MHFENQFLSEKKDLEFNLEESTIMAKFTDEGEQILQNMLPSLVNTKDDDGYYEIFTKDLFSIFGMVSSGNSTAKITDLIDGKVKIPEVYLKEKNGRSIMHR